MIVWLFISNSFLDILTLDNVRYGCGVTLDKATVKRMIVILLILYLIKVLFGNNSKDKFIFYCKLLFKKFKHYLYGKLKEVREV